MDTVIVTEGLTRYFSGRKVVDRLDLAADAAHTVEQLLLLADSVTHGTHSYSIGGYSIRRQECQARSI